MKEIDERYTAKEVMMLDAEVTEAEARQREHAAQSMAMTAAIATAKERRAAALDHNAKVQKREDFFCERVHKHGADPKVTTEEELSRRVTEDLRAYQASQ